MFVDSEGNPTVSGDGRVLMEGLTGIEASSPASYDLSGGSGGGGGGDDEPGWTPEENPNPGVHESSPDENVAMNGLLEELLAQARGQDNNAPAEIYSAIEERREGLEEQQEELEEQYEEQKEELEDEREEIEGRIEDLEDEREDLNEREEEVLENLEERRDELLAEEERVEQELEERREEMLAEIEEEREAAMREAQQVEDMAGDQAAQQRAQGASDGRGGGIINAATTPAGAAVGGVATIGAAQYLGIIDITNIPAIIAGLIP